MLIILGPVGQRQENPWDSLTRQPSLISEAQAPTKPCLKGDGECSSGGQLRVSIGLHMNMSTQIDASNN